jgi:hypothetical protein
MVMKRPTSLTPVLFVEKIALNESGRNERVSLSPLE